VFFVVETQTKRPPFQATLSLKRVLLCVTTQATPVWEAPLLSSSLFANAISNLLIGAE
jgi:hypothetical protein